MTKGHFLSISTSFIIHFLIMDRHTDSDIFIQSKAIRNQLLGKLEPKKITVLEAHLLDLISLVLHC